VGFCDRGVDESIPVIEHGATDAHNDVNEAVSRALRHVGKRNNTTSKAAMGMGGRDRAKGFQGGSLDSFKRSRVISQRIINAVISKMTKS